MIRAHDESAAVTLVVDGPATMTESPAVSDAVNTRISRGARAVRLDLRGCTSVDSTFSGTLLSLERQLEKVGGTLTLVSPSPKVLELLQQMGLEDFYEIEVAEPLDDGTGTDVPVSRPGAEQLGKLILEAHDQLAAVPGVPATTFGAVVEELRREEEAEKRRSANGTTDADAPHSSARRARADVR